MRHWARKRTLTWLFLTYVLWVAPSILYTFVRFQVPLLPSERCTFECLEVIATKTYFNEYLNILQSFKTQWKVVPYTYIYFSNSVKGTLDIDDVMAFGLTCSSSSIPAFCMLIVCSSRPLSLILNKSYFLRTATIGINKADALINMKHSASPHFGYGVLSITLA